MTHCPSSLQRLRARLVVWAMAALVPVQAVAGAALATLGPLHTHRAAPADVLVLEDFRRVTTPAPARPTHVATVLGHFHGDSPARHRHDLGEPSVVAAADDPGAAIDGVAGPAGAALAAAVALCGEPLAWHAAVASDVRAAGVVWAPQTHDPPPLERPPRAA